jgi:hypothetical protein
VSNYAGTVWAEDYLQVGSQAYSELEAVKPPVVEPSHVEPPFTIAKQASIEPFPTIEELKERARVREQSLGDHGFYVSVEKKVK